jgi:hypothetical protein
MQASVDLNLRKYIDHDAHLLATIGWNEFMHEHRGCRDLGDLEFEYPAARLLCHVGTRGVPIVLQLCYNCVTTVLQLCYHCVTTVL